MSGIGEAISRNDDHAVVSTDSERVAGLSLLAALQRLLQRLEVADAHLSLNITDDPRCINDSINETLHQ